MVDKIKVKKNSPFLIWYQSPVETSETNNKMTDESMYSQEYYYCNHMATTTRWDVSLFHSDIVNTVQ